MAAAAAKAARERGVQSMVGFNYRRVPALALARELIAEGRLGDRPAGPRGLPAGLARRRRTAPMTWRLRKETAGSGALGDIASHAIDQVLFLLGEQVTEVTGRLHTFAPHRPGANGPEEVTVDDAAWATLALASGAVASVEVSRVATGRKNSLKLEVYGDKGALLFDLENLNELDFLDARRRRTGLPPHPRQRTRAPLPRRAGGRRATSSAGNTPSPTSPRLPRRDRRGPAAVAVVRGRARRPAHPGRDRGKRRARALGQLPSARSTRTAPKEPDMPRPYTLFTGQWADLPLRGSRPPGLRLGLRRPGDRRLRRPPGRLALGRARLRRIQARRAGEVQPQGLGHLQPPQGPGRLR